MSEMLGTRSSEKVAKTQKKLDSLNFFLEHLHKFFHHDRARFGHDEIIPIRVDMIGIIPIRVYNVGRGREKERSD
jgi:hypothetical protein